MAILTLAEKASLVGPVEYSVLKFLFENRLNYEYIYPELIVSQLNLKMSELSFVIEKLKTLNLIRWKLLRGKQAIAVNFSGTDVLAIKALYRSKVLKSLGITIGEGKESIVNYGYNFDDDTVIVKFHRVGVSSFKNFRKKRGIKEKLDYISLSVYNAKKEYEALECVHKNYGSVPKPYGYAYNTIVMEYIEGKPLYQIDPELIENPKEVLEEILSTVRIAYEYCDNMIHGDLSPYNVLYSVTNKKAYVIDWPQWSKNNTESLKQDLINILTYFKKKYNIDLELSQAFNYVMG